MAELSDNVSTVQPWTRSHWVVKGDLCVSVQSQGSRELPARRNAAAGLEEQEARLYECIK